MVIIFLLKSCVKWVAFTLLHLTDMVDTWLENLHELGASLNVVFEVDILAMYLRLNIAVFTVRKPSRAIAIATTSASKGLDPSTRAAT